MNNVEKKIANPLKVYDHPDDILRDNTLNRAARLKVLNSLEHDANQLLVATAERLEGGERPFSVKDIHVAREKLTGERTSLRSSN